MTDALQMKPLETKEKDKTARVSGLFLHPQKPYKKSEPVAAMTPTKSFKVVAGGPGEKSGILGSRFFGKNRQVTGIETEVVQECAKRLNTEIRPGDLRSDIEFVGLDLLAPVVEKFGQDDYDSDETKKAMHTAGICLQIGESAVLRYYQLREPCWKMDRIAKGLEDLMWTGGRSLFHGKQKEVEHDDPHLCQGVIFQVAKTGTIQVGDAVKVCSF